MFILTSILVVSLGAADLVFAGIKMNRLTGYSNVAYFAGEAGAERALWEARKNGYILPESDQSNVFQDVLDNNSSYQVNFALSEPTVTFTSIGSYQGVKRSVETSYQIE